MTYIKLAVLIAIIVAGILLGTSNTNPATIKFFTFSAKTYPLFMIMIFSFLAGVVAAFVYNFLTSQDMKSKQAEAEKKLKSIEDLYNKHMKDFKNRTNAPDNEPPSEKV